MELLSTRDRARAGHSYTDVLLSGLAPDGGLYVPTEYPIFSLEELQALGKDASYAAICLAVKRKLVGEAIGAEDLQKLIAQAYTPEAFTFEYGTIVPVRALGGGIHLCNLSLGPTASFKDMAMQLLGREMEYELNRRDESLVILGATSGDTGSAAEAALRGLSNITLFMLSPESGMSDFQKAQMGSLSGENIYNISVRGRFDDCQDLVKTVKADPEFAHVGAVNSINWGRVSSQVPYYFAAYLQVVETIGDPVDFCVPSGNFGNAFSCYVAQQMGLPVRRIIIATNENAVLDKLVKTGVYETAPATITSSPSMDISKASNYERLVFDLLGRDAQKTSYYMNVFAKSGRVLFADVGLPAGALSQRGFVSGSSTHKDRLATIRRVYEENAYVIDPHTADGVHVAKTVGVQGAVPIVCMETALPVKFESTIREALGFVPPRPSRFAGLEEGLRDGAFEVVNTSPEELKAFVRERITSVI